MNHFENKEQLSNGVIRKINALWVVRQEISIYSFHFSHTQQDVDYHTRLFLGEEVATPEVRLVSRDMLIDYRLDELIPMTQWQTTGRPQFILEQEDWHNVEQHLKLNYLREIGKTSADKAAQKSLVENEMGAFAITQIGLLDLIGDKKFDKDLKTAVNFLTHDITDDSCRSAYKYHKTIEEKTAKFQENYTPPERGKVYERQTWWRQVRTHVMRALHEN